MLLPVVVTGYLTSSFFEWNPDIKNGALAEFWRPSLRHDRGRVDRVYSCPGLVDDGYVRGVSRFWGAGAIDAGLNTYVAAHFGEGFNAVAACQFLD